MKRFAVLFGVLAVVLATAGGVQATAPSVGDLPDIRLEATGGDPTSLPEMLLDAYDVLDFVKDFDDAATGLTVSILSVDTIAAPAAGSPASATAPAVDFDASSEVVGATEVLVDIYGSAAPQWASYEVKVVDASTAMGGKGAFGSDAITSTAIVKYATFVLGEPTLTSGRDTDNLAADGNAFAVCLIPDATYQLYRLDAAISPASASASVDWELVVNSVAVGDATDTGGWDANGNWLGLEITNEGSGAAVSFGEIYYSIDANGALTLTTGGSISEGPFLVGILATDQGDSNNADGARILVAEALVTTTLATSATAGNSVTLNDLAAATIAAPTKIPSLNSAAPNTTTPVWPNGRPDNLSSLIGDSMWTYQLGGNDSVIQPVDLEIVDLATESLPAAAVLPWDETSAHIAGGMAFRATLDAPADPSAIGPRDTQSSSAEQLDGFRLQSTVFTEALDLDEVVTFSLNVASDAANASDLPKYQMAVTSALGGSLSGLDARTQALSTFQALEGLGIPFAGRPLVNFPGESDGWRTLSIPFSRGASPIYFDYDADGDFDGDDLADLDTNVAIPGGWGGVTENNAFIATFLCASTEFASNAVTVWVDNLCVHKSAYAIDLAWGLEQLTDHAEVGDPDHGDLDDIWTALPNGDSIFQYTSGDLDGTFESIAQGSVTNVDLKTIGMYNFTGAGKNPVFKPAGISFQDGGIGSLSIASRDHTNDGNSANALEIDLGATAETATASNLVSIRTIVRTTNLYGGQGGGVYSVEAYVGKAMANSNQSNAADSRDPQIRVLIGEVWPNFLGTAQGTLYVNGGLPSSITGDPPFNWKRAVAELYIPDPSNQGVFVRGDIQVLEDFANPSANFIPLYLDDLAVYKVGETATFFDAELFGISL